MCKNKYINKITLKERLKIAQIFSDMRSPRFPKDIN